MRAIFKREMRAYFASPVGYVVVAALLALYGFFYYQVMAIGSSSYITQVFSTMFMFSMMIMPIITMATSEAAIFSRYARSAMIDALRLPCVRAARMRGLPERRIIWLHALPNAMLSILTILGFFLGTLVAGAVITENVFSWPGVGKLLVQSVASRDIPVVQMIVLVTGASLVTANLLMDLLALVVNPRLRKGDN
mgnify:CR=1 FL=1